jgi:hypothetical protein
VPQLGEREKRRGANWMLLWMHRPVISEIINRFKITSAA